MAKNALLAEDVAVGRINGIVSAQSPVLLAASPAPVHLSRLPVYRRVCLCAVCCANEVLENALVRFCKLFGSL